MKKKPVPIIIRPNIILYKEVDTFPLSFLLAQNKATEVPKKIINIAFKDWNQEAGTNQPINILSVFSMVYIFIKPPACSNAPQKTITNKNDINKTTTLSFSILVKGFFIKAFSSSF